MTLVTDLLAAILYSEVVIGIQQLVDGSPEAPPGPEKPIELLKACHRRVENNLAALERAAGAWTASPLEALATARKVIQFFAANGAWHSADEEESLFPRLRERSREAKELISRLEADHRRATDLHQRIERTVTSLAAVQHPAEQNRLARELKTLAGELQSHYAAHIACEDEKLFPLAARYLRCDDLAGIRDEMKRRRGLE